MKRFFAFLLCLSLMISVAACGGNNTPANTETKEPAAETGSGSTGEIQPTETPETPDTPDTPEAPEPPEPPEDNADTTTEQPSAGSSQIEVETNIFSVELTIPKDLIGEGVTQESLDATAAEKGYKSATLNEDGSVTYIMTKAQHNTLMEETRATIEEGLADIITSGNYPSFVEIRANETYSAFEVVMSTDSVGLAESFSVLAFYMYGGLYNSFNGTPVDNVSVAFINQATGEVIQTANSKDAQ